MIDVTIYAREWRCDRHPENVQVRAFGSDTGPPLEGWICESFDSQKLGPCGRPMSFVDRIVPDDDRPTAASSEGPGG